MVQDRYKIFPDANDIPNGQGEYAAIVQRLVRALLKGGTYLQNGKDTLVSLFHLFMSTAYDFTREKQTTSNIRSFLNFASTSFMAQQQVLEISSLIYFGMSFLQKQL
jgi:hypothetical protein